MKIKMFLCMLALIFQVGKSVVQVLETWEKATL